MRGFQSNLISSYETGDYTYTSIFGQTEDMKEANGGLALS